MSLGLKWACLAAAMFALWMSYGLNGAPYVTNDGYQYLDAATNLASRGCLCTNVALFDEQVAYGRMPVPFTHFAPGYPLLIAGLARTGLAPETAGYLLSAFGFLAVLWLIWDIGLVLGATPWVIAAFSLLWITDATALYYAAMVGTESLYAALMLATVAVVVRDVRAGSKSMALAFGIGLAAGLSYWMRYPGLFVVAAADLYLVVRALRFRTGRGGSLAGLGVSALLVGSIQLRNALYTGSWRGGFANAGEHSLLSATLDSTRALIHLVTGDRVAARIDIRMAALVASCVLLAIAAFRARRKIGPPSEGLAWVFCIGIIYIGGVFVASIATIAADFPRYYFPVYPLLLAGFAVACSAVARGIGALAIVLVVLSVTAVEVPNLMVTPPQPDWILTRAILNEHVEAGTLAEWLQRHVAPNVTILAVEGQAVHYLLQRPVVAVVEARYTSRRKDEQGFHALMRQERMEYLLILPGAPPDRVAEQTAYPFLVRLAAGDTPSWLRLAAQTRDAAVYQCTDCVN